MKFVWDEEKNWENDEKHGILFEEAQVIWLDPFAKEFYDDSHSELEHREFRVGLNPDRGILLVVFCEKYADIIRIISARVANTKEQDAYFTGELR